MQGSVKMIMCVAVVNHRVDPPWHSLLSLWILLVRCNWKVLMMLFNFYGSCVAPCPIVAPYIPGGSERTLLTEDPSPSARGELTPLHNS
ncbi:hypothetical protein SLE2022_199550 [Rubroshorea leprosula]